LCLLLFIWTNFGFISSLSPSTPHASCTLILWLELEATNNKSVCVSVCVCVEVLQAAKKLSLFAFHTRLSTKNIDDVLFIWM